VREQLVEPRLADHIAQHDLRPILHRRLVVLDGQGRLLGIEDAEVEHRVDHRRHVVARDDHLPQEIAVLHARVDAPHLLDARQHEREAGLHAARQLAERKAQRHLPLVDLADAREEVQDQNCGEDDRHHFPKSRAFRRKRRPAREASRAIAQEGRERAHQSPPRDLMRRSSPLRRSGRLAGTIGDRAIFPVV
jgi:hypothetical protein